MTVFVCCLEVGCCVGIVESLGLHWKNVSLAPVLAVVVMVVKVLFWVSF